MGMRSSRAVLVVAVLTATFVACAEGSEVGVDEEEVVPGGDDDASPYTVPLPEDQVDGSSTLPDGGSPLVGSCPAGSFVTGVDANGLVCTPFVDLALAAMRASCRIFLGWRDSCDGCTLAPTKWGAARTGACDVGNGSCTTALLGGKNVSLYGLLTDGDVNDDDKFYVGFSCDAVDPTPTPGPCGPGAVASEIQGGQVTKCIPAAAYALGYVRQSCSLYAGWIDNCSGCTTAPTRWGRVGAATCSNGVGTTNTCTTATLGAYPSVQLFGLNTGGDVDGNDKFHIGLRCEPATPAESTAASACPPGQLVAGVSTNGVTCKSPDPDALTTFRDRCGVYFGWRDQCPSCTLAPSKWGLAREGFCQNGLGANGTCVPTTLGGNAVYLYGLNTAGDVNGDDRFYVGLHCE